MFKEFINLLFPDTCLTCDTLLVKGEHNICFNCMAELPRLNYHREAHNPLMGRFLGKVEISHVMAYLKYTKGGRTQKLIHALKYHGEKEVSEMIGNWFGADLKESGFEGKFDVVLPVPLHHRKLRQRKYNQVTGFGKAMAQWLGAEFSESHLIRNIYTSTQTQKKRFDRWSNVASVFQAQDEKFVHDKRILLVDDVVTTGSTLEACAHAIWKASPKSVSIATMAAAD